MTTETRCRSCQAVVVWGETSRGKRAPFTLALAADVCADDSGGTTSTGSRGDGGSPVRAPSARYGGRPDCFDSLTHTRDTADRHARELPCFAASRRRSVELGLTYGSSGSPHRACVLIATLRNRQTRRRIRARGASQRGRPQGAQGRSSARTSPQLSPRATSVRRQVNRTEQGGSVLSARTAYRILHTRAPEPPHHRHPHMIPVCAGTTVVPAQRSHHG